MSYILFSDMTNERPDYRVHRMVNADGTPADAPDAIGQTASVRTGEADEPKGLYVEDDGVMRPLVPGPEDADPAGRLEGRVAKSEPLFTIHVE